MSDQPAYELVSAESHIVEPPDVFDAVPASLRDRAPQMVSLEGAAAWVVEGAEPIPLAPTTATGSGWLRAADGARSGRSVGWESVLPALYDPAERTRAQWHDSIDAEILYPTPELWDAIRQLPDVQLKVALARAYNDWIAGFCGEAPDRLFGLAKLPTTSVEDARVELVRCVSELGLRGAILDAFPSGVPVGVIRPTSPSGRQSTTSGSRSASTTPSAPPPTRHRHMGSSRA